jgi:anti-sigma factor RsiW
MDRKRPENDLKSNVMNPCPVQSQLDAFHDGELQPVAREEIADHLGRCSTCARRVESLRHLSGLFGELKGQVARQTIEPGELSAIHEAVDATASPMRIDAGFIRAAGVLMTMAASVLIVSAVWLVELHHGSAPAGSGPIATAPMQPWERVAMGDPATEGGADSETNYAVNWMVDSLHR